MKLLTWRGAFAALVASALATATLPGRAQPAAWASAPVPAASGIDLRDFVHRVVVENLTVEAARLQAQAAEALVDSQRALYDPAAFAKLRRDIYDRPRTYEERTVSLTNIDKASAIERISQATGGLRGRLPTGAVLEISHDLRRRQSNLLASLEERENRGTLTLTLRQPLLRDAGQDATEADLRVAELEQQVERQKALKQLLDTVGEAAGTYWQLHHATDTLKLRQTSLERGRALEADVRRRVEGGFAPRTDLAEAALMLSAREAELLRAGHLYREAQARVRNLLGQPVAGTATPITPSDAPQDPPALALAEVDPLHARELLDTWPPYQIARLRFEQEELRWRHAGNQALPDLAFELGYNQNSLAAGLRVGLKDSLRDFHPGWYAGLNFEMPLGNRAASSRLEAQRLRRDSARLAMESEANMAGNEWSTRLSQQDTAQRTLALARADVVAREGLVAAERLGHERGRVRLAQLLEAESRLEDARVRRLDAMMQAQLALLSTQALDGRLLRRFDVDLATR